MSAAKFLSIPAIISLFGKSLKCLYLSQISMDLHSVKKHLNASVLPQFLSTHLTSSFNFRKVQIWPRTFPQCNVDIDIFYLHVWTVCVSLDYLYLQISVHNVDIEMFYPHVCTVCVSWDYLYLWYFCSQCWLLKVLPSCIDCMCVSRLPLFVYFFSQYWHWYVLPSCTDCMCQLWVPFTVAL